MVFLCISKQTAHRAAAGVLALVLGCCAVAGLRARALAADAVAVDAATHEWGLSFQEENQPPVPNLSAEQLRPYDAYYCGDPAQKRLYLTFDAGYDNGNAAPILDALKKHNAPGAFFIVGTFIQEYPDLVKRMVAEGHTVGNHTYHHPNMTQKDQDGFTKELQSVEQAFQELTGQPMPKFYRPPEGKFTDENLRWAQGLGYKTVFWSLAYVDWEPDDQPSKEKAFSKLLPRTHPGAIVLLHSTSATNAAILDELLTKWEELGYTFGDLSELGAAPAPQTAPAAPQAAPAQP